MTGPNRYDGPCRRCGTRVPTGTGTYDHTAHGCLHPEGQCKTTTKTYQRWADAQALATFQAAVKDLYTARGYTRWDPPRIEHAAEVRGHGLLALVGGDRRGEVFGHGIRVFRTFPGTNPMLIHECPRFRIETGDFYADQLAQHAALLDLLGEYATETADAEHELEGRVS